MAHIQIGRTGLNSEAFEGMTKAEFKKQYSDLPVNLDHAWDEISKALKKSGKSKSSSSDE